MKTFGICAFFLGLLIFYAPTTNPQTIKITNAQTFYDLCTLFANATGSYVEHCGTMQTCFVDGVNGELKLSLVSGQPTCNDPNAYDGLCVVENGGGVSAVLIETGNGGKPIFVISND